MGKGGASMRRGICFLMVLPVLLGAVLLLMKRWLKTKGCRIFEEL